MDKEKFHPIEKNITVTLIVSIIILIFVTSFVTYRIYTKSFYERYRTQMESIVNYIQRCIDDDDMSRCADTYVESEKYKETQAIFDDFIDHYSDIHYLYMVKVLEPGDPIGLRSIMAANSTYDKENEALSPENVLHLGDGDESWYDDATVEKFREILNGDKDVFFLQPSAWGVDYCLSRPLIDSSGKHYGLLCVDVSGEELKNKLYRSIFINIAMIIFLGGALILVLLWWMRVHVTEPLKKLEDSVREYADSALGKSNPDALLYTPPELKINNEIKSLGKTIAAMSLSLKDYARNMAMANKKVEGLEGYVNKINDVAYYDPLTKVKNMAAYEKKREELEEDIFNRNARFAIVMADVNNLKKINDEFGHDMGNVYIVGACSLLSDIFKRSPIFRVGGDEFVIVLEGKDYANREELKDKAVKELERTALNKEEKPWRRYSAAIGMSIYVPGEDMGVEEVFKRADEEMYTNKAKMKAARR